MKNAQRPLDTVQVLSRGLWRIRRDIETIVDAKVISPLAIFAKPDAYVGWGARKSGIIARAKARLQNCDSIILEDGFLKGYSSGLNEPMQSFVLDHTGIYFDTRSKNDYATLLNACVLTPEECNWAQGMMTNLREQRITKFNNWPDISLKDAGLLNSGSYLLLIDQVTHDASIAGAGAGLETFEKMLVIAADNANGRSIVVRTHPSAVKNSMIVAAASKLNIPIILAPAINPWLAIENADEVYTISSQMGFEALLAGKPVRCFGQSFYAGRGLTTDNFLPQKSLSNRSLEQLFYTFHQKYARYLDIHTRKPCTFENAVEQAIFIRNQRMRLGRKIFTGGLSPWKRKAITPFLIGPAGAPSHKITMKSAIAHSQKSNSILAVWGARNTSQASPDTLFIEDGFVRSVGLGARLTFPASLTIDHIAPHYNATVSNELVQLLNSMQFNATLLKRAVQLRDTIILKGITKYNTGTAVEVPIVAKTKLKILVPGQVEADASIKYGAPEIKTNKSLVSAVRVKFPDAYIAYKLHPDVVSGMRSGGELPIEQDITVEQGSANVWIDWCDRVETLTSLTGFEALIRQKPVGTHGIPFYAGWGLTDDRLQIPGRSRLLTLDGLIAVALIAYPFYIHPKSKMPLSVESLIVCLEQIAQENSSARTNLLTWAAIHANKLATKLRDRSS